MGILLLRVDERLIHGQVTVGWGSALHPDRYVVVDDRLAGEAWEQEIHALGVPEEAEARFRDVASARGELAELRADTVGTLLLTRDLDHMVRLAAGRALAGETVQLGGLHHAEGRREVLPWLFLDAGDRERIRTLEGEGVRVVAQDLPGTPPIPAARWLDA